VIVGREDGNIMLFDNGFVLIEGCSHAYANGFGFIRSGNDAAIVVAKYHNGFVPQIRSEEAFTGTIETVTIDDGFQSG
jgi:hypothetical protein